VKLARNFQFHPALIGLVPLVNVLFLVVLFFTLGSRFLLQPGFAVSLPSSSFALAPGRQPQLVSIAAVPVPAIYHGDQRVTVEELDARLAAVPGRERTLVIKADRRTPYDLLARVMNVGLERGFALVLAAAPEQR
jgi:biopolymer transport protein ExbD